MDGSAECGHRSEHAQATWESLSFFSITNGSQRKWKRMALTLGLIELDIRQKTKREKPFLFWMSNNAILLRSTINTLSKTFLLILDRRALYIALVTWIGVEVYSIVRCLSIQFLFLINKKKNNTNKGKKFRK